MEITIHSGLNCDGYIIDGKFYSSPEMEEAIEKYQVSPTLATQVTFIRGKNVFDGVLIDNGLFYHMVSNFWKWVIQYQN